MTLPRVSPITAPRRTAGNVSVTAQRNVDANGESGTLPRSQINPSRLILAVAASRDVRSEIVEHSSPHSATALACEG